MKQFNFTLYSKLHLKCFGAAFVSSYHQLSLDDFTVELYLVSEILKTLVTFVKSKHTPT